MITEKVIFKLYKTQRHEVGLEVTVSDGELEFESVTGLQLFEAPRLLRDLADVLEARYPLECAE